MNEQWLEGNLYEDYRSHKINFDNSVRKRGGNGKILVISIDLASEFWLYQAIKGNIKAQALAEACITPLLSLSGYSE